MLCCIEREVEEEFSIFVSVYSWFILGDLLFYALTCRSCCRRFHRQVKQCAPESRRQGRGKKILPEAKRRAGDFFQSSYTLATLV